MDLCNELCFWPNLFIPAMLIGTIDFNHFILLSLILTLPAGHKVIAKQNLLASFSTTLFIWSGWNLMLWWSNSSWTSWDYFRVRFIETSGITAVLQTLSKNFIVCLHSDFYELILFKLGTMMDTVVLCVFFFFFFFLFITFWYCSNWFRPWFKVTGVREKDKFCINYLTKFEIDLNGIWYAFETCWLDEPHTHYIISSIEYSRKRTLIYDFVNNFERWLVFRHLQMDFFQTSYDDRDH